MHGRLSRSDVGLDDRAMATANAVAGRAQKLSEQVADKETELGKIQEEIDVLQQHRNNLQEEVNEHEAAIEELEAGLQAASDEIRELRQLQRKKLEEIANSIRLEAEGIVDESKAIEEEAKAEEEEAKRERRRRLILGTTKYLTVMALGAFLALDCNQSDGSGAERQSNIGCAIDKVLGDEDNSTTQAPAEASYIQRVPLEGSSDQVVVNPVPRALDDSDEE